MDKLIKISTRTDEGTFSTVVDLNRYCDLDDKGAFSGRTYSPLNALFSTFRHKDSKQFLKELTLPTLFNVALKLDDAALDNISKKHFCSYVPKAAIKVLSVLGAFSLDLLTSPIRITCAAFNALFNFNSNTSHPLAAFLRKEGLDIKHLDQDSLTVTIQKYSKKLNEKHLVATECEYKSQEVSLTPKDSQVEAAWLFDEFLGHEVYNYQHEKFTKLLLSEEAVLDLNKMHANELGVNYDPNNPQELSISLLERLVESVPEKAQSLGHTKDSIKKLSLANRCKLISQLYKAFAVKYHPDKSKGAELQLFYDVSDATKLLKKAFD